MATKVKGEAIQEGSIPLSALVPEVRNKIENSGGGANWNAQEGEAGFILNKPFRVIKSNNNEITNINSYFLRTEDAYYPNSDLFIKYDNKIALLVKENRELYWGDGATLEIDSSSFFLVDDGDSNIIVASEVEFELIITLSSDFIPDTVIKTTPQTLSNTEKNKALANLGIDLIDYIKNAKIIIDFSNPGRHTFEEYGIDLAKSNGLLLAAMVEYLTGGGEIESVLVETINMPNYDNDYTNTSSPTYIGHTYTQYLDDYEKDFGYGIDILNKTISIWGID